MFSPISALHVRNLDLRDTGGVLPTTFARFHSVHDGEAGVGEPFHTCVSVEQSLNPSWTDLDLTDDEFILRLWQHSGKVQTETKLLLEQRVSLRNCVLVAASVEELTQPLPWYTVLLAGPEGLYAEEGVVSAALQERATKTRIERASRLAEILQRISAAAQSHDRCLQLQNDIICVRENIKLQLEFRAAFLKKSRWKESQNAKINVLKKLNAEATAAISDARSCFSSCEKIISPKGPLLFQSVPVLYAKKRELDQLQSAMEHTRSTELRISKALEFRRSNLLHTIQLLFPIVLSEDGSGTISGIRLAHPINFQSVDEDVSAAALGHVAMVTATLAKYLSVVLRYQIVQMSSRSSIRDTPQLGEGTQEYPLYARGQDRTRTSKAIFLLLRNIQFLACHLGYPPSESKSILHNLSFLYSTRGLPVTRHLNLEPARAIAEPNILMITTPCAQQHISTESARLSHSLQTLHLSTPLGLFLKERRSENETNSLSGVGSLDQTPIKLRSKNGSQNLFVSQRLESPGEKWRERRPSMGSLQFGRVDEGGRLSRSLSMPAEVGDLSAFHLATAPS